MPRQFKQARQINKLKMTDAAEKLGISQPTLSAWADLYGVTTDFLLGRTDQNGLSATAPIPLESLPVFHGNPFGLQNTDGCWSMRSIGC